MSLLIEQACQINAAFAVDAGGIAPEAAQLCNEVRVSCVGNILGERSNLADACAAYREAGFRLLVITLSWNALKIAVTAIDGSDGTVIGQFEKRGITFEVPTVVILPQGEHLSRKNLEQLLEQASQSAHPVKILAALTVPRSVTPFTKNGAEGADQAFGEIAAAQQVMAQARELDRETVKIRPGMGGFRL